MGMRNKILCTYTNKGKLEQEKLIPASSSTVNFGEKTFALHPQDAKILLRKRGWGWLQPLYILKFEFTEQPDILSRLNEIATHFDGINQPNLAEKTRALLRDYLKLDF